MTDTVLARIGGAEGAPISAISSSNGATSSKPNRHPITAASSNTGWLTGSRNWPMAG